MITKEHATETLQMEFGKGSYAIPNVHYLGLSTSAISEDTGTGFTEPTDANYSRKALTNVAATWTTNSAGEVVNAASLEFAAFAAKHSYYSLVFIFFRNWRQGVVLWCADYGVSYYTR